MCLCKLVTYIANVWGRIYIFYFIMLLRLYNFYQKYSKHKNDVK